MTDSDFGKPIIAIANSFTEFVPGHIHLRNCGTIVAEEVAKAGGVAREFNTIAVDDGIAMGHAGMLYSLPSRELIADSIEYMVNAHCADALVCISNCDKITPGMLVATMRLNIPTIFVCGGPMESGRPIDGTRTGGLDLIHPMAASADPNVSDAEVDALERSACPTCGSCSGMFSANSINCLLEALGLALPGNGTMLATHSLRQTLFENAGKRIVEMARSHYEEEKPGLLPREIATARSFENAVAVDMAMGGSTNSLLHLLAAARTGGVDFSLKDIDRISRAVPHLSLLAPASDRYHVEDFHRAGGVFGLMASLDKGGYLHTDATTCHADTLRDALQRWDVAHSDDEELETFFRAAPGGRRTIEAFSQDSAYPSLDLDRRQGCIRDPEHAIRQDAGLAVLFGNLAADGCVVKTAAVADEALVFEGPARVFESEETASRAAWTGTIQEGDVVVIRYEGPKGGPGMQEMLYPSTYLKARGLDSTCALITDGRFSGGSSGLSIGHISPEAAEGGLIGLVEDGDRIAIDIPQRTIRLLVDDEVLARRREAKDARDGVRWEPSDRDREVSDALKIYARTVSSASDGAVRDLRFLR